MALHNWRVRNRLIALIMIPTVAAVVLGAMRVISAVTSAAEYQRVSDIAAFTGTLGELVHELELERDLTGRYAAGNRTNESELNLIDAQQAKVDLAAEKVRGTRTGDRRISR